MMRVIILFSALHRTLDQKSGAKPQENSGSKAKPGCCTWLNLNESLSSLPISLPVPLLLFLFLSFRLYTLFFCTRKRRLMGLKSKKKKKQKKTYVIGTWLDEPNTEQIATRNRFLFILANIYSCMRYLDLFVFSLPLHTRGEGSAELWCIQIGVKDNTWGEVVRFTKKGSGTGRRGAKLGRGAQWQALVFLPPETRLST